jgi:hypothetical protein
MDKVAILIAISWIANASNLGGTITVRVANAAGVRAAVIATGEIEASFVFKRAGIVVRWADCPTLDGGRGGNPVCSEPADSYNFTIVIGDKFPKNAIEDTALGFAMPFSGFRNYAEIAYPRVKETTDTSAESLDYGGLLGAIMAHELGHLLFSSNRHGPGIMQANWTRAEFKLINQRRFLFTVEQAEALRTALRSRYFLLRPNVSNRMAAASHK